MRLSPDVYPGPISREEIERVKRLRDAGADPPPQPAKEAQPKARTRVRVVREEGFDPALILRMNGREQAGLYALGGANQLLDSNVPEGLERRIRRLKMWWRFRGAVKTLQRVQQLVEDSAEDEQVLTIRMRSRHLSVYVGMDSVNDPEGTWVRIPDLNTVVGQVLEDTCGLCVLDAPQAQKCPLRRALRAMTTITDREIGRGANGCIFKKMSVLDDWGLDDDEAL